MSKVYAIRLQINQDYKFKVCGKLTVPFKILFVSVHFTSSYFSDDVSVPETRDNWKEIMVCEPGVGFYWAKDSFLLLEIPLDPNTVKM